MFDEEEGTRDRWLFALLVIAVFGALIAIRVVASTKPKSASPTTVTSVESAPDAQPWLESPAHESIETPLRVQAMPDSIARIYECERDGQRVLSDQPCGAGATVRIIREPNRMQAQDTSRLYERSYEPSRRSSSSSHPTRTNAGTFARCEQIERQIDAINASMRQGYKNAERRRQRLRELSAERWDLECRFLKTPASLRN